MCYINKWFKANLLLLNLGGGIHWLQFSAIKDCSQDIQLAYKISILYELLAQNS